MESKQQKIVMEHTITIIPRYNETDQGGVVHHSVYPVWFEMGRTELLRVNNTAYKDLEAAGIYFVIAELDVRYKKPARYDQKLQLLTTCSQVTAATIEHTYKLMNSNSQILAKGRSVLVCVGSEGKVRRIPRQLQTAIE